MRIKLIKAFVSILGYKLEDTKVNLPVWQLKKKQMPAYEYKCTAGCNDIVVKVRSIKEDDPGYNCETCNVPMERVYSNIGAVFNGSGFYSTDNRKRQYNVYND